MFELKSTITMSIAAIRIDAQIFEKIKTLLTKDISNLFNLEFPKNHISKSPVSEKWRNHKRDVKKATAAT